MRIPIRLCAAALLASTSVATTACGRGRNDQANSAAQSAPAPTSTAGGEVAPTSSAPAAVPMDTAPAKHHSKLAGALAGAAVGHALGHHALAGAAAGALIQHERNHHHR